MKKIKIIQILSFVLLGSLLPFLFVCLIKSNSITFPGSNIVLGITLFFFIIICAGIVSNHFKKLNSKERLINVIIGTIIYTIIYICAIVIVIKPEEIKIIDTIVTGYYGVFASCFLIYGRNDESGSKNK